MRIQNIEGCTFKHLQLTIDAFQMWINVAQETIRSRLIQVGENDLATRLAARFQIRGIEGKWLEYGDQHKKESADFLTKIQRRV